jgi:hypothetical protein
MVLAEVSCWYAAAFPHVQHVLLLDPLDPYPHDTCFGLHPQV